MSIKPTPVERGHYAALVGRTITRIQWAELDGQALPILHLSGQDKRGAPAYAIVLADPEGNAPGHLDHAL